MKMRRSLLSPGLQFFALVTVLSFFLAGVVRGDTNVPDSVIQSTTAQGAANRPHKPIPATVSSRGDVSNLNATPVLNPRNLVPSIFTSTSTQDFKLATLDPAYGTMSLSRSQTGAGNSPATPLNSSAPLPRVFFSMDWNHFITFSTWPSVPIGSIRLWDNYVSWEEIETAPGRYNWTNLDTWLGAAAASDTDVLYAFGRTPPWASLRPRETCGYGVGCAAPPADVDSGDNVWKGFVTALVQHSLASKTSHIKYYELWNEPDCTKGCTWTGTDAQLVTMARDAYNIIHTLDPKALVLGPSPHGLNVASWLHDYYAAGGVAYQDIVSFHAYAGLNLNLLPSIVDKIRVVMAQYGISNQPLWATEGNWAVTGLTPAQQVAYLAQQYISLWSKNVARFYWYSWDGGPQWGQLWTASSGTNTAGTAYGLLENWLIGSVRPPSPCRQSADATWYCTLTLSNGDPAEIVWNPDKTIEERIDPPFTTYRTLDNASVSSIVANTVSVGNEPILLVFNRKH
jgi:polysaccharide biosynthesis protein PslG